MAANPSATPSIDSHNMSLPSDEPGVAAPMPQLALLDFFFPGFSVFAGAVQKYLRIDLNLYIPLVVLFGALTLTWNYSSQYFWESLESHFMSTVDIRTDDEIYNILMTWVANQSFAQRSRRFVVNTNLNSRSWYLWRWDSDEEEDDGSTESAGQTVESQKKKALSYTPSFGSHYFWYRGRVLLFRRAAKEQNSFMAVSEREEISVSCFGRNPWILKELLLEARTLYIEKDQQKTLIYRGTVRSGSTEPTWQRCMARSSRPFSTVILNEKTKTDLIEDVTDYLHPATQRWYSNRGIPYRRGYLLYGPPGTGKSSLSLALAGFFRMRIYIVSLSSINSNEENLAALFAELPRRCVVLLEDIDTAGLTHTRDEGKTSAPSTEEDMEPTQLTPGNGNTNNNTNQTSGRLSLSGLLNILDGVASQEGRVLIMTTNHMEKLDKALIRPGRVDMIVEFGLADSGMVAAIFSAIFAHLEGDDGAEPPQPLLEPEARKALEEEKEQKQAAADARVKTMAVEFASRIPAHEFSPAELQGHLMRHKRDPRAAIDKAAEFVEQTRKDRKEKEIKDAEDKRKAEEKKKKEEEDKKKEEEAKKKEAKKKEEEAKKKEEEAKKKEDDEKKLKEEKKEKRGKAKEAERKKKQKETKRSGSDSDLDESASGESASESEAVGNKKQEKKKDTPKIEKPKTKDEIQVQVQESEHERKDSGYVSPASVEA